MLGPGSTLRLCAALVGLQAAGLTAISVFLVVELLAATSSDVLGAGALAGLVLVAAAALGLVARGLLRRRRWARSPALVTNVILLPVAYGLFSPGTAAELDEN